MRRKLFCLLLAILTAVSTFACGKKDTPIEKESPCPNCGYIHFEECLFSEFCNICGDKGHNTENHPLCGVCNGSLGLLHSEDECTGAFCEYCRSEEHSTENHPLCEIEGCNRYVDHITGEHPECTKCKEQHYPYCSNGKPETYCEICGKDTHNNNGHHYIVCKKCGNDHPEPDSRCPEYYCENCNSIESGHTTMNHDAENGAGNQAPTGNNNFESEENSTNKYQGHSSSAVDKYESESEPEPDPKSEPKPKPKPEPEPKAEYFCNNCGKNTSHNTANCPKLGDTLCASCGHPIHTGTQCKECNCGKAKDLCSICAGGQTDHTDDMHCKDVNCTKYGKYHTDNCVPIDTCSKCSGNQTTHTDNDHCNNNACEKVGQYHTGNCIIKKIEVPNTCSLFTGNQTDHTANDHCDNKDCSMYGEYHSGKHTQKDLCSKCDGVQSEHSDNDHCNNESCSQYGYYHGGNCNTVTSLDTCRACSGTQADHTALDHCQNNNCALKGSYHTGDCDTCTKCPGGDFGGHTASDPHCNYETCEKGVGTYHYPHKCSQCGTERCEHIN